jgi:nucleotide-binding universal stress UspA family protein
MTLFRRHVVAVLFAVAFACKGKGPIIVDVVIDCGVPAVSAAAADLLPTVVAILTGNAVNWADQLDALRVIGEEALACAMERAAADLEGQARMRLAPGQPPPTADTIAQGRQRAHEYAVKRGWKAKPAP